MFNDESYKPFLKSSDPSQIAKTYAKFCVIIICYKIWIKFGRNIWIREDPVVKRHVTFATLVATHWLKYFDTGRWLRCYRRSCGPMDKATDYESEDCRFESCQDQIFTPMEQLWSLLQMSIKRSKPFETQIGLESFTASARMSGLTFFTR